MNDPRAMRDTILRAVSANPSLYVGLLAAALVVVLAGTLIWGFWFFVAAILLMGIGIYLWSANLAKSAPAPGAAPTQNPVKIDASRLEGKYRAYVQRALDTQASVERTISSTNDPGVRRALTDSTRDLPELVQTIYTLAFRSQSVQAAIGSSNRMEELSDDIKRIDALIQSTTDEFQKSQYYSAMDGKLQQMQNLTDTEVALKRWEAQLDNALSALDTILTQILRIKSSEVLSYSGATDDVSRTLRNQVDQLKATSDALDTVYGSTR